MWFNVRTKTRARLCLLKKSGKSLPKIKRSRWSRVRPNITILQPVFSPLYISFFFLRPPDSTDLSLKCEDSKALSLQTCDFFQKISRSNLWLADPWQLHVSLFLPLLPLHLVEKLSDSHLYQAAQVFIMCMHTEYPARLHTSKEKQAGVFNKPCRNSHKERKFCSSSLLIWWASISGVLIPCM